MPSAGAAPRNILLVHEILPHFDCSGADLRLYELVREIRLQGHRLTLLARNGCDAARYVAPLEALGASVVADDPDRLRHAGEDRATGWNLRALLERERFDIAILSHWFWSGISVVEHYLNELRQWSPDTRILVLSEDRHGERERRSFQLSGLLTDLERGNDFEQREVEIYRQADLVLYVTETDHRHFRSLLPDLPTEHLPTIAEAGTPGGGFAEREGLLFLGNFDNLANRDAVRWLLTEVWPLVRHQEPEWQLYIAGSGAGGAQLVEGHANVRFLGKVPDLAPTFAARRVFVSPIRFGTGIITKNMLSMAHGLPVVTTAVGAEGMALVDSRHALIAHSPQEFAASILRLYRNEELWNSLSCAGREYIAATFSLANLQDRVAAIVDRAVAMEPRRAARPHVWSYRAVETSHPEVLTRRPAHCRGLLRTFAYWQTGRRHLDTGRPREALEQFRHIFPSLRGRIPGTVIHTQLLRDMARSYRELGDAESAQRCERELGNLAPLTTGRLPSEPRRARDAARTPELSVVLPTCNRESQLRLCLTALAFQTLPAHRWEAVVVDDGSSDGTGRLCRDEPFPFPLQYLRQENAGIGAARRAGVAAANGDLLLLCNDDTIAAPNLLAEHLTMHRRLPGARLAVLGDFRPSDECGRRALSLWLNWSPFVFPQRNAPPGEISGSGHFITCNLSIRRAEVLKVGSFDPAYRVGEDTELGARLERNKLRILYHPAASAWHDHPDFTTADLLRRARTHGKVWWALYEKHPWMLRDGKGPVGCLSSHDFSRIRGVVEEQRLAATQAIAGLEALDDIDFSPFVKPGTPENAKGLLVLEQLKRAVPLVYWNCFYASFLEAWQESQQALSA